MFTIDFDQTNGHRAEPHRLTVHAEPADLDRFEKDGYLVVPDALTAEQTGRMREAVDRLNTEEFGTARDSAYGRGFGGHFLRGLLDRDAAFHDLLTVPRTVSVIRAMLGPRIQIRSCSARTTYPGTHQETAWHIDQPSWIVPRPRFFAYPPVLNCIYFLDDVTPEMGALSVVPGTHLNRTTPPTDQFGPQPGQVDLCVPAGTAVLTHCAIRHKGGPNTDRGALRRNVLVDHSPVWMKDAAFDGIPSWGGPLTTDLLAGTDDPQLHDLLGRGGVH